MNWTHFPPAQCLSSGALAASKGSRYLWLLPTPKHNLNLQLKPSQPVSSSAGAQESPCSVLLEQHLCSGLATLPLSQVPPGCCSVGCTHVNMSQRSHRVPEARASCYRWSYAVFLQECTSEVITLSVNSGELSTSNDRAITCWPLPKIIQQLFQLFCHPKKTLFQFQLAGFFNHKSIYFQQDIFFF